MLATPFLLSGLWGLAAFVMGYMLLNKVPMGLGFFYPLLLAGVTVVATSGMRKGIPFTKAGFAGFASGFVYMLISPMFPLIAAILSGACLGGGLSSPGGRMGGLLGVVVSTLKGAVLFPVFVLSGEFLGMVVLVYSNSVVLTIIFWGVWLGLGVAAITRPFLKRSAAGGRNGTNSRLEEFKTEAREIDRDLGEFNAGID